MASALPRFLRHPLSPEQAFDEVRHRFEARERRFLDCVRALVYDNPASPYRELLRWAGCEHGDLESSVRSRGLETTLAALRDGGVHVTLAELKATAPIVRGTRSREVRESDFDNPFFDRGSLEGSSSASRSRGTRVGYDWALIREHAATELVLNDLHGAACVPLALWLPPLPSIAGMQCVLMNLTWRRVPAAWFSPVDTRAAAARHRLANAYIRRVCGLLGYRLPRPRWAEFARAAEVAGWISSHRPCLLRTYVSSAVRLAQAARTAGLDLAGCTILCGGEPLTEERREFVESTGARIFPRYSATEAGLIGAACDRRTSADDMHVYLDRVAVVQHETRLLFTSLSPHTGKVLLNADLGDCGTLEHRACACSFGRIGMTAHVSNVRSPAKFTAEGMNVLGSDLDRIVGQLVAEAGGSPDSYQFWETARADGTRGLVVAIDPDVPGLEPADVRARLLERLAGDKPSGALTSRMWDQARTLEIVRAAPRLTRGHKFPRIIS